MRKAVDFPDGTRQCGGCGGCGERLPLERFDRDRSAAGGRRARCKGCRSVQMAAYYADTAEVKRAQVRNHRRENGDRVRESDARRYERNRAARIELATDTVHRRRARLSQAPSDAGVTRSALRRIHGDACCYCSAEMTFESQRRGIYVPTLATIEHVVPVSRGGSHTFANCRLACWSCNIRRGNRDLAAEGGAVAGDHSRLHGAPGLDQAAS